jgi:hypothetical protein
VPVVFGGLAKSFVAVFDRDGIGEQLTAACASWVAPQHDAAVLDVSTWAWLRYLHGRLCCGEHFAARAGLFDALMYRVVPMLGSQWHCAHAELSDSDMPGRAFGFGPSQPGAAGDERGAVIIPLAVLGCSGMFMRSAYCRSVRRSMCQ